MAIFALLCATLLLQSSIGAKEVKVECFRDGGDIWGPDYYWEPSQSWIWGYAESSDSLPALFAKRLNGTGVFYADGNVAHEGGSYSFNRQPYDDDYCSVISPSYLYIKYYLHAGSSDSNVTLSARPALNAVNSEVSLPRSRNFEWTEQLVELDTGILAETRVGIIGNGLLKGDYFLLDTIALIQGQVLKTVEDAAARCDNLPRAPTSKFTGYRLRRSPKMRRAIEFV